MSMADLWLKNIPPEKSKGKECRPNIKIERTRTVRNDDKEPYPPQILHQKEVMVILRSHHFDQENTHYTDEVLFIERYEEQITQSGTLHSDPSAARRLAILITKIAKLLPRNAQGE